MTEHSAEIHSNQKEINYISHSNIRAFQVSLTGTTQLEIGLSSSVICQEFSSCKRTRGRTIDSLKSEGKKPFKASS